MSTTTNRGTRTARFIHDEGERVAHNYDPLPVVVSTAEDVWVTDVEGRRYLDLLSAYSALNFGHRHPELVKAAVDQIGRLTLTSRAFHNDRLGAFANALAELCRKDLVLPMNTGAEAVETGIKAARAWAYRVKGVPADAARIIVAAGNFHGRTTTIVGFSDDPLARNGFGPFTPGFVTVPYQDAAAIESAIDENTAAVLIEPIQGEAGVIVPPPGYLRAVRELCTSNDVLLVADEIQSGLGRTGTTFACDREDVVPDLYLLGKALGGGILPVSAVVGDRDVVELLRTGEFQERAIALGRHLERLLDGLLGHGVTDVRVAGLWAGIDIDASLGTGREIAQRLLARGVLVKDTHGQTIRMAPPLTIEAPELDWAVEQLQLALQRR